MTAEQPQPQTPPRQVEPATLPPVVSLAEAAHLDPAQAPALLGTGSWDRGRMAIVVPYDPTWPQRFQAASAEILAATDHRFLRLEHIGSTSVPGLAAKPTIDMMASVRRLLDGHAAQPALAALGYELADTGMRERLFFQRLAGPGVSTTARAARNDARTDIAAAVAPITLASLPDVHLSTANIWAEASSGSWFRYLDDLLVIEEDDRVDTQP
jgi:hypothetical protein